MKKILAILMAVLMLSSSIALAETAETPNWLVPYEETPTITWGRGTAASSFPEPDNLGENEWVRWVEKTFNVNLDLQWEISGNDYMTAVNLAMVDASFPDIFAVSGQQAKQAIRSMIDSGFLAPLNEAYEEYASPMLREVYDSYGGIEKAAPASLRDEDGNFYAFSATSPGGEYELVWIRMDWLEKLNLPVPTTWDELIETARAFVANKLGGENTYGFHITNSIKDQYNQVYTTSYWLHNFKAYPGMWYANEEGNYVYGSVQPEVKDALQFLADAYAEGLINKEFSTIDFTNAIPAGEVGITSAPWWTGAWPLNSAKVADPNSFWEPIWVTHADGEYHTCAPDPTNENSYWVVSADCENPEFLVKMLNLSAECQNLYNMPEFDSHAKHIPTEIDEYYSDMGYYAMDWGYWPMAVKTRYNDQLVRMTEVWNALVEDVKAGKEIPVFNMESFDGKLIVNYMNGVDNSDGGFHVYSKYVALNLIKEHGATADLLQTYNPAPTDTMELAWTGLQDMESQLFVKIVMGLEPVDAFDQFVKDWYAQGGEAITAEVDAQLKGK